MSTDGSSQAEDGWLSVPNPPGPHLPYAFAEGQIGSTVFGPYDVPNPGFGYNQWERFWNNPTVGTTVWNFYYKIGNTNHKMPVTYDLKFAAGVAEAETGRWGHNTSALDEQEVLQYRDYVNGQYNWVPWGNNYVPPGDDGINGWKWQYVAQDHYKIVSCTPPC